MKRTVLNLFSCCLMAVMASCGNSETKEEAATLPVDTATTTAQEPKGNPPFFEKNIPAQCYDPSNCDLPVCLDSIMAAHTVPSRDTYMAMIRKYYGSNKIPAPLVISGDSMGKLLPAACNASRLLFDLAEGDITTHGNVVLSIADGWHRPTDETNSFSISLFRAVMRNPVKEFRFTRAKHLNTYNTLAMEVLHDDGTIQYLDLSNVYPK